MNIPSQAPLPLDGLRPFEAVARTLSFRAAAAELHVTQPAVSRQIQALERRLGAKLFARGTRRVELTDAGHVLQQAVVPALERIDRAVLQLRRSGARRSVSITTYASFATLWLLPRLASFQAAHPDIDIRISTTDQRVALDDPGFDLALRFDAPGAVPQGAERLFDEVVTPVCSPLLAPRPRKPADLAQHALVEEDDPRPSAAGRSWARWFELQGLPPLEPRRRTLLAYTHQLMQAAAAGQGVALGRVAIMHDALARGELVELFSARRRVSTEMAYWMILLPQARLTPQLRAFAQWVREQAADTRGAIGQ